MELVVRNRQDRQAPPSTVPRMGHSTSERDTVRVARWQTIQLSFHSPMRMAAIPWVLGACPEALERVGRRCLPAATAR